MSAGRLQGWGIVITRPREPAEALAAALAREGARPIVFPALGIEDLPPTPELEAALASLPSARLAIFVSAHAVEKGLAVVRARGPWPAAVQVAGIGEATAQALRNSGFARVISPAERHDSEALLELPELQAVRGARIVVFRGEGGRERLREELEARGAEVRYAQCYRRVRPEADAAPLLRAIDGGEAQAVSVLSGETLSNFVALVGDDAGSRLRALTLLVPHEAVARHADARRFARVVVTGPGAPGIAEALSTLRMKSMTEPSPPSPQATPPAAARPAARPAEDRTARWIAGLGLALTLVAGWIAIDARLKLGSVEASAGGRLSELGAESQQSRALLAQAQQSLRDAQARITELEGRVADTQEQRVALEEMYRELSRSADDRVLSEVEQMLVLASQQLQLAGNVRGALGALQAADQRLARAEKLAATPLRRAIAQDMEKLKAVPQLDTGGVALRLDQLIAQADSLPLIISETLPAARVTRVRADETGIARVARDFWEEMKGLVRIRDLETQDAALLTPAQGYFLRENLKLRLLAARMSVLARDEASFRDDMRAAQAWIAKYFDAKARPTQAALASLKLVAETPVTIAVPDINASLAAVRTARTAREKR